MTVFVLFVCFFEVLFVCLFVCFCFARLLLFLKNFFNLCVLGFLVCLFFSFFFVLKGSHRQDITYHYHCHTSSRALVGMSFSV